MGSPEGRSITVVVADDEAHVRAYLEVLLHDEGFVVLGTASDTNEVVQLAHQTHPDVAVIDLRMPGSGLEAVRMISSVSPETRLVIFSAEADDDDLVELLRSGIDGYVTKGSDPDRVADAIRSAVTGGAVLDPTLGRIALDALTLRLDREMTDARRAAIDRDRVDLMIEERRFRIVHQPIVHIATGASHAVEALTRFDGAARTPLDWFRDAERVGRGTAFEVATMAAALEELDRLRPELAMTVNVSPATVVAGRLAEVLTMHPACRIVLELTEHAQVHDVPALNRALSPWRERGVLVAIDDTGAGHSSFSHVLALRPDLVKLDQAIIAGIERDAAHRSLVKAVVAFAADEGLGLIAEGIETERQLDIVTELGVAYAQGFHLGRPRPLDEQPALLAAERGGEVLDLTVALQSAAALRRGR